MNEVSATHCAVIDEAGEIVFSVSLKSCMGGMVNAKQFCNDHINDACASKVPNARKWVVRFMKPLLVLNEKPISLNKVL